MFGGCNLQRVVKRLFLATYLSLLASWSPNVFASSGEFNFSSRLDNGPISPAYVSSVVTGDLDGDGDLDVVIGNGVDRANIVLLNDGTGQFIDSGQLLGNAGTLQMHLADFDGDSDLDLLTMNGSTQVQDSKLYFNDGAGYFSESQQQFSSIYQPRATVGDVDNDGDVDIVRGAGGSFDVLVNDGSGTFTILRTYQSSSGYLYPNLGDVDGDGDLDLITNDRNSYVYFNDGTGDFSNQQALAFNGGLSGQPVVLGDVNGDGNLDIAAPRYASSPSLFFGDGTGAFTDSGQSWLTDGEYIRSLNFADVDADGDLDLIYSGDEYDSEARRWNGRLGVLVNDGTGVLTQSEHIATDDVNGTYYNQFVTGDLDNDNDIDALVASSHGGAFVFLNGSQLAEPADPILISPAGEVASASPVFEWQADSQADSYRMRIYDRSLRAWIYDERHDADSVCNESTCVVDPGVTLDFSKNHQWRLAARNAAGWSATSVSKFDYLPDLPPAPTQIAPLGEIETGNPEFEWTQWSGNVLEFRVRVYDRAQGAWVFDERLPAAEVCDEISCSFSLDSPLEYSYRHVWRVAARNARGWSDWSVSLFNYLPDLPSPPVLVSPQSATDVASPAYVWQSENDILEYRVRIYDRAKRTWIFDQRLDATEVCDGPSCSISPDLQLNFSRKHQWRVTARNVRGWSGWSYFIFDYLPEPPTAPNALSPLGEIDTSTPTYQWENGSNAIEFRLRIYDRLLRAWVYDERLMAIDVCDEFTCSWQPSIELGISRNHQWRIATRNVSGWSGWTATFIHYD